MLLVLLRFLIDLHALVIVQKMQYLKRCMHIIMMYEHLDLALSVIYMFAVRALHEHVQLQCVVHELACLLQSLAVFVYVFWNKNRSVQSMCRACSEVVYATC